MEHVHGLTRVPKAPEENLNWPSQLIPSWAFTGEGPKGRKGKWKGWDPRTEKEDGRAEHGRKHIQ